MVEHLNIKDKLNQLYDIRKEISEIKAEIKEIEKNGTGLAAIQESRHNPPYGKHDIIIETQTSTARDLISRYKSMLQERYNKLLKVKIEVEEYIEKMPTSRLRRIFELKYIKQYTWRKIAFIIGGNATEDSIKQEHSRYLKEN